MINIPNEPLLFDLFYGGKGAGEESEEDLLNRMQTSIPPVTEETPAFHNICLLYTSTEVHTSTSTVPTDSIFLLTS